MRTDLVRRLVLLVAIVGTVLVAGPSSVGAAPGYDWTALDARLQRAVLTGEAPGGLALVLRTDDGTELYRKTFGVWDEAQVVPIGSSTKWLAGVTFMTLVQDGVIDLDDPLVDYLPAFDDFDPAKGAITFRMALAHQSGLPRQHPCFYTKSITLQDCVDQIALAPQDFAPGTEFAYGGGGYQVAARAAEVATGESWVDLVQDRVVALCGITFSYDDDMNPWVAGGGSANLGGYDSFLGLFRNDGYCGTTQVLTSTSIDEMFADQVNGLPISGSPYMDGRGYGLGVFRDVVDAGGNALQVSHAGLFGAHPWLELGRGYSGFLIMTSEFHLGKRTFDAILPLINSQVDANA